MDNIRKLFHDSIICGKEDTQNPEWRNISAKVQELVNQDRYQIELISPKSCVENILINKYLVEKNLMEKLDELEKGFYCLTAYAINLCRAPHKTEYKVIKVYFF